MMEKKLRVGILGATGMVGQRFISLLEDHPWFQVVTVAASARSAGKTYEEAVGDRWKMTSPMPEAVKKLVVMNVAEVEKVASTVDFVFCAVDMKKEEIRQLEEAYAKAEMPVVSNNSAHRGTPDVPMVIPEINPEHTGVIPAQRRRLGTERGFIAVKSNCSLQSYVPALHRWSNTAPRGAGHHIPGHLRRWQDLCDWPEMVEQRDPLHPGRGREERAGAIDDLGDPGRRRDRKGKGAGDHLPVYPRSGPQWPYGGCFREIPEKAVKRTADRKAGEL